MLLIYFQAFVYLRLGKSMQVRIRARGCGNTLGLSLLIVSLPTISFYPLYPQMMKF